jgi:signal transduction histidine kinase
VLGEIAAVAAHDINNLLSSISMFSQMLVDGLDASSPLHPHARIVHRNTASCARTVRSLLGMAATSSPAREECDVHDLVDEVIELLRPLARQSETVLHVDAEAEDSVLCANELQLRQALVNLVMNAIQATAKANRGAVTVGTSNRDGELVLRVGDNGPGIPGELRERVFEPFFTTKPRGEGTGLGLPTTKGIIEAHGGRLILRGGRGGGTVFEMIFPPRAAAGDTGGWGAPRAESFTGREAR